MARDDQTNSAADAQPGDAPAAVANQSRPLPGPARWLGAKDGYSPEDLTSLQVAYETFEVARPDPGIDVNEVLELRIHGVGGASAESNLETPTTLLVAGDQTAGFYRAWFPGQNSARTPLREAYCWGKFSYSTVTSAVWLLLLPFALVNLASWALPAPHRASAEANQSDWRQVRRVSRVLLRLLGLVLTVAFFATLCFLLVDIVARQAVSNDKLPGWLKWLNWFQDKPDALVEALALAVVLAALAALRIYSMKTTGKYERWSPGTHLPVRPPMRLSARGMWAGYASVRRQQLCHVLASCAVIITFAGLGFGPESWQLYVAKYIAVVMAILAAMILVTPGCDRLWVRAPQLARPRRVQVFIEAITWLGTVAAVFYLGVAGPHEGGAPGYDLEVWLLHVPVIVELAALIVLLAVLLVQLPWKQDDVFVGGFLSVILAGLAVAISTIFGGALLLTATKVLSTPTFSTKQASDEAIFVPGVVASGSVAFLFTIAAFVCVGAYLLGWRIGKKETISELVPADYPPDPRTWLRDTPVVQEYRSKCLPSTDGTYYERARKKVAGVWATSRMTDLAGAVGAGLAVPTLLVLAGLESRQLVHALVEDVPLSKVHQPGWVLEAAQWGSALTVAATIAFIGFLRGALVSEAQRRKFAFFWDVVNFWPRAAHPFAPPCYAERVVPEVTTRIRRIVGDEERNDEDGKVTDPAVGQAQNERDLDPKNPDQGFEPHRPVVLNGYSQGSPISVAVVAQLPGNCHESVGLLTLACPAHRLYGRAFPLYFGPDQLQMLLSEKLTHKVVDETTKTEKTVVRWINLCRRSDYVGGPIGMGLDRWILDPPALWPSSNPSPPPMHLHSDWFPDPKTHPPVLELRDQLPTSRALRT